MKSLVAGACLAVSLGCASLGSIPAETGPLRAHLLPHSTASGGMSFRVSRPAHVAVFRITPGGGTSLVYPWGRTSMPRRVYSGFHTLDFSRRNDPFMLADHGYGSRFGPEFYFMIASEEPLRIEQFGPFGDNLRTMFGTSVAFSAYSAMESLVSLSVPNVDSDSWTTDYYVHWPENDNPRGRPNLTQISCNGRVISVPAASATWAANQLCNRSPSPDATPPAPPEELPADSVVGPRRRPPVHPIDRITSSQLSAPEEWDQLRGAAEQEAVIQEFRMRRAVEESRANDSGAGAVYRSRPERATDPGATGDPVRPTGRGAAGDDDAPSRSRPSPEASRQPDPSSTTGREASEPSGDGDSSVGRSLAPIERE